MSLESFGFKCKDSPKAKRKKLSEQESSNRKKEYEKEKRERKFIPAWKEKFGQKIDVEKVDGGTEEAMFCVLCRKHPALADKSSSMFVGTNKFRYDTITSHLSSKAHVKCEEREMIVKKAEQEKSSTDSVGTLPDTVKRQDKTMEEQLKRLITTAYSVCKNEWPFTHYTLAVEIQEINGLDMGDKIYRSDVACRRFAMQIFEYLNKTAIEKLQQKRFLSVLIDGATDSSVTEQELVYVRCLEDGEPVNHYLSIESLEHAHADGVLATINNAFERVDLNWKERVIGFGSDGASVNLGKRGGVAEKMNEDVDYLVVMHCVAHRLELAVTSATKDHHIMKSIQDMLQRIYKHYYYSPKALRELHDIAAALDPEGKVLKPGNLGGTRWLPHIHRATSILVKNYPCIVAHFDHVVANRTATPEVVGRATFVGKQLKDHKTMYFLHFFLDIFEILTELSLKMQEDRLTLSDFLDALETAHLSLVERKTVNGNELTKFLNSVQNGVNKGTAMKNVQTEETYNATKQEILELISNALDARFKDTEKLDIVNAAAKLTCLADYPTNLENLVDFCNEEIHKIASHFSSILARNGCDDMEQVNSEWRDFKAYVKRHHSTCSLKKVLINESLKERFRNVFMILEICLVFPLSSSCCERGFSAMKRLKSDWRTTMNSDTLRMLMYIVIEGPRPCNFNAQGATDSWWGGGQRRPGYNPWDFRQEV